MRSEYFVRLAGLQLESSEKFRALEPILFTRSTAVYFELQESLPALRNSNLFLGNCLGAENLSLKRVLLSRPRKYELSHP